MATARPMKEENRLMRKIRREDEFLRRANHLDIETTDDRSRGDSGIVAINIKALGGIAGVGDTRYHP